MIKRDINIIKSVRIRIIWSLSRFLTCKIQLCNEETTWSCGETIFFNSAIYLKYIYIYNKALISSMNRMVRPVIKPTDNVKLKTHGIVFCKHLFYHWNYRSIFSFPKKLFKMCFCDWFLSFRNEIRLTYKWRPNIIWRRFTNAALDTPAIY